MKTVFSLVALVSFSLQVFGQKIEFEKAMEIPSLTSDSYCGSVAYDEGSQITSIVYVENNNMMGTKFKTYTFDKEMNFLKEDIKSFPPDMRPEQMKEAQQLYSWFNYKGPSYTKEWIDFEQSSGGKISAIKQKAVYNYYWALGSYIPKYDKPVTVKIKSETDDKVYLYTHVVNTETGDAYLIVGNKAPKGSDIKNQHCRNFQIVKVTKDLEVEYLEEFKFKYNMCVSFSCLVNSGAENRDEDEENTVADISGKELYAIFAPVKGMFIGKDQINPNKGESKIIAIDDKGKLRGQLDFNAPTSGWLIKDMVKSPDGKDYYFFGPAKDDVYTDQVAAVKSPLLVSDEAKDIKYKNYQIMKVSNKSVAWINSTPLEDFETRAVAPPSQKKVPEYKGKNFDRKITFVSADGELIIAGQNYEIKYKKDPKDPMGKEIPETKYADLLLIHFDNKGALKKAYGVRRDEMNKYSKSISTPMNIYLSPDGKQLYWVYGEIQGMKRGFDFGGDLSAFGVGSVSKKKLLYFPAVAKLDLSAASIGDFKFLGADAKGKQLYFTNPSAPQIMSADGKKLIFVGENKSGSMIWLAKLGLD